MITVTTEYQGFWQRFRPLAGFWFLNHRRRPSSVTTLISFRPLAGFWFLNIMNPIINNAALAMFPSPCGVLVLKFLTSMYETLNESQSFRPLAGFWFLNIDP